MMLMLVTREKLNRSHWTKVGSS